ncbi:MAG TPA: T9SS type A sorting domain-containing protein [Paludibacteraceae bacterium]|nr:T9SS type A sorting domain-containing protein [Paludibacteraceae bacterium]HQF51089.1 T9SS type A sorting domain-containing protein [Paludibacteraceae bacterium]HQJ89435.1 T9SS type A sorting domain-containing protein [Paludibacteraceae bacterium]
MKRLIIYALFFLASSLVSFVYSEEDIKFYSNGDYGIDFLGKTKLPAAMDLDFRDCVFDEEGNFYCLLGSFLLKVSPTGETLWTQSLVGDANHISWLDGALFVPIRKYDSTHEIAQYADIKYEATRSHSYFLLKIEKENGNVIKSMEIEVDDFVENGFDPFDDKCNGYAISPNEDIYFMFDINENYSRVNKDIPVSFERHGDNDKCLFRISKDLEYIESFCLGSEGNDETEEVESEHLSPYMTFAGDTLFMYVPFLGKECNISLDSSKTEMAKNKTLNGRACAAFCKYLVKNDNIELLTYRVISGNDGQIKRFAVNSKNKVVAAQPNRVWDGGVDSFYDIMPDMTLRKLEGFAYVPTWAFYTEPRFWFDTNDDIIRYCTPSPEVAFTEEISFLESGTKQGARMAKYDGVTLENKWVVALEDDKNYNFPFFRLDSKYGFIYLISPGGSVDFDPTEEISRAYGDYIARYIEIYRVKTASEHASIVVNGGNDMVRHGEDAEVVVTPEKGYHIESITTSEGENLNFTWNGHCTIKNVTEPVTLVVKTAEGNSIQQQRAAEMCVYPNPVENVLYVEDADGADYEIQNLSGIVVRSGEISDGIIDFTDIASGFYSLIIKNNDSMYSIKIVKK